MIFPAVTLGHFAQALPLNIGRQTLKLFEPLLDRRPLFGRRALGALVHSSEHAALFRRQVAPDRRIMRGHLLLKLRRNFTRLPALARFSHPMDALALLFGRQVLKLADLLSNAILLLGRGLLEALVEAAQTVALLGRKLLPIFQVLSDALLLLGRELMKLRVLAPQFLPILRRELVEILSPDFGLDGLGRRVGVGLGVSLRAKEHRQRDHCRTL